MFVVPENHRPKIEKARKNFLAATSPWVKAGIKKVLTDIKKGRDEELKKAEAAQTESADRLQRKLDFYAAEEGVFRLFLEEKIGDQPNPFCCQAIQNVRYDQMEQLWMEFLQTDEMKKLISFFEHPDTGRSMTFISGIEGIDCMMTAKEFTDAYREKAGSFYYDAYNEFLKNLRTAFPYEKMDNKGAPYNGYVLCRDLDMNVCIYCNANLTLTVTENGAKDPDSGTGEQVVRPALDHYMAKARFPILRMTFDNLIPACNMCNSGMKKERIMLPSRYLHPYQTKQPKITFVYGPESDSVYVCPGKTSDSENTDQKSQASLEFFRTGMVYEYFGSEARKIREKEEIYTPEYLADILKLVDVKKSEHFRTLHTLAASDGQDQNQKQAREQFLKDLFGYVEEKDAMGTSLGDMRHDLTRRILEKFQ